MATTSTNPNHKPALYSFWRSSCSYRVRIALNLKKVDYDTEILNIEKGGQDSEEFKKINPMGRVPALYIDRRTIIESMAIMIYVDEQTPNTMQLLPTEPGPRTQVFQICELINAGIQPMQNTGALKHLETEERKLEWAQYWIKKGFDALEKILEKTSGYYCVGDKITLADCCLVPQVFNARKFNVNLRPYPLIMKIDMHLESNPAVINAHPFNQPDCPPEVLT